MPLAEEDRRTLVALVDCIIPADDFPSASENGVVDFIQRLLEIDLRERAEEMRAGLIALNEESLARHDKPFADLDASLAEELLGAIEANQSRGSWPISPRRFFDWMIALTHEGFYTDPSNGSNLAGASWRMIGYDPRVPPNPVAEKWVEIIRERD